MSAPLRLASVHLRVPDLARSLDFYVRQLGFVNVSHPGLPGRADLAPTADAPALLTLLEDRAARHAPTDAAGLFHAALLLPDRAALGRWLRFAGDAGVAFEGFSDHGVSEAIYLSDPDGNGLEFYADRPRAAWPRDAQGQLAMTTLPLAIPALLAEAAATPAAAPPLAGARWGHLHLRVTDLDRSEKFYGDTLGLFLTQRYGDSARFLAADGYHHNLGLNTWTRSRRAQPPGALGLAEVTFARGGPAPAQTLRDPDGLTVNVIGPPSAA